MRKLIVVLNAVLVLAAVNYGIFGRERLLTEGRVVLLELAPVDPRSLMQGDYMALRFKAANEAFGAGKVRKSYDGRIVLLMDERGVARFARFEDGMPLAPNEVLMRYRIRGGQPKFATNAFFFQEGHARHYQRARYGEFRVAPDGESILTALRSEDLKVLGPPGGISDR
jgi:uncharacterized membrane-anchored protein